VEAGGDRAVLPIIIKYNGLPLCCVKILVGSQASQFLCMSVSMVGSFYILMVTVVRGKGKICLWHQQDF